MWRTLSLSLAGAAVLASTVAPAIAPAIASAAEGPPVPVLNWTSTNCYPDFQCATARVPLDYRRPNGTTITIAVLRHLATDPANRLGTLFFNGGGPSEQLQEVPAHFGVLPAQWRARYDIIGFDPRGFGYSSAVQCFPTPADEQKFLADVPEGFPVTPQQIATWDRTWARFAAVCAQRNGPLLRHNSTADVARDMDLLRQAVGAPRLNYVGFSYGTALGAVYANLFPDKVGRMVLDGNLDPVVWADGPANVPFGLRVRSAAGSSLVLKDFLDLCGQASTASCASCAFSAGSPAATEAKFATLLDRLYQHPVTISQDGQSVTCDYSCGVGLPPLGTVAEWSQGASLMEQVWAASGTVRSTKAARISKPAWDTGGLPPVYGGLEQHYAVLCADTPGPQDPNTYTVDAGWSYAKWGPEALGWLWTTEPCVGWPKTEDAYRVRGTGPPPTRSWWSATRPTRPRRTRTRSTWRTTWPAPGC